MSDHKKALADYLAATNSHDFDQVAACLSEKAVYYFSDQTCSSLDEIRSYFEKSWQMIQQEVYSAEQVVWLSVGETQALCLYRYRYQGLMKGELVSGSGRATNVFEKTAAGWLLVHEHLSAAAK